MNADELEAPEEESFASWLVACDEALAAGVSSPVGTGSSAPPGMRPRLERGLACLQVLENVWPRRAPEAPTCLGRFAIRHELGRGGYGVVFLAHDPQLGREVALKVPRANVLADAAMRQRFQHEARLAGGLDHPNLVPVYDAGEDGGICYIASAYCPGITLAAWLHQRTEPIAERAAAELVATLADGVQHAHSRGVLHRDLKPANILLTFSRDAGSSERSAVLASAPALRSEDSASRLNEAVPRITDFGLAKHLGDGATQTQSGDIVGTPAYMAPEQAEGRVKEIGTAADIYALGAVLYELLTHQPPFRGDTLLATLEQVRTQEPAKPRHLRPRISRDLETICLKCLEKEPARRYASAATLADDLRRFLAGEPIQARPGSAWERCLKWARRKPVIASLAAALLLAVLGGFGGVFWQWRRAEANFAEASHQRGRAEESFRDARDAVNEYLTKVSANQLLAVSSLQPLRKELFAAARTYHQKFLQQRGDDPDLVEQVADSHFRLAAIEGHLGDRKSAVASYRQALVLMEQLVRENPDTHRYRNGLARTYNRLGGVLLMDGLSEEVGDCLERARALQEALVREQPANIAYRYDLAVDCAKISDWHRLKNQWDEARRWQQRAVDLLEEVVRERPDDAEYRYGLAIFRGNLGNMLRASGRPEDALRLFEQSAAVREEFVRQHPEDLDYRSSLGGIYHNQGRALGTLGRHPDAMAQFEKAIALQSVAVGRAPQVLQYRMHLINHTSNLSDTLLKLEQPDAAIAARQQLCETWRRLVRDYPDQVEFRSELGGLLGDWAEVLIGLKRFEEAEPLLRQAITEQRQAFEQRPAVAQHRRFLLDHLNMLANLLLTTKPPRPAEAIAAARECLRLDPRDRRALCNLAGGLAQSAPTGEEALRERHAVEAVAALREAIALGVKPGELKDDPAFASLRSRADFQQLLR